MVALPLAKQIMNKGNALNPPDLKKHGANARIPARAFQAPGFSPSLRQISLTLLTLAAFALRAFNLGGRELRGDETFGQFFSAQNLDKILAETLRLAEPHPPFGYFLLHFWQTLAGATEFALRYHSLFFGVLLVPLIYRLAQVLWEKEASHPPGKERGLEIGLLAASLMAISPYQIWHAREARMYALSTALGLASSLFFLRTLHRGGFSRSLSPGLIWAGYVLITALSLYTHYYALFLLAFQTLFWLIFWRDQRFLSALGAILALFLPWLAFGAWRILIAYHGNGDSPAFLDMVRRVFLAFGLGEWKFGNEAYFLLILAAVFGFGLWEGFRSGRRSLAFLLLYLALPVLSVYVASLRRPVFNERYLAAASPPFYIILALGLVALRHLPGHWRWSNILCALFIFGGSALSLYSYYFPSEEMSGPGWRTLARHLEEKGQEGDFILANYPDPTLWYYYRGELPHTVLPASRPLEEEKTVAELRLLASSYQRIWFIPLPSPDWDAEGFVGRWLARHCDRIYEESLGKLRLELYLTPPAFRARMTPVEAAWEGKIKLAGYWLETKSQVLKPGWPLYLTLYWEALAEMGSSYTVFTHLLGPEGRIWGQKDGLPLNGSYPTLAWKPGETVVDKYIIIVSGDAPAGEYALELGWYEGETGRRLFLASGEDKLTLPVRIIIGRR